MTFRLSVTVIFAAFVWGGGSRVGFFGDVAVQLLAVPLFVIGLRDWGAKMMHDLQGRNLDLALHFTLFVFVGMVISQLVPRGMNLELETEVGAQMLYLPDTGGSLTDDLLPGSVAPAATWASVTSLIPFFAVFFGVSKLDEKARFKLALFIISFSSLALVVGFVQVMQGPNSDLRFFEITNPSEAVGFFANRNHFAAQLYATFMFAAVLLAFSTDTFVKTKDLSTHAMLSFVIAAILVIFIITGIFLARSRAGLFLAMAALAGALVMFAASRRGSDRKNKANRHFAQRLSLAALAFAILFAAQFGVHRVMTRFETDPLYDLRLVLSPETLELAIENMPFGAGLGSFVGLYASNEKTQHLFNGYANRAHNDWAELLLETGLFGCAIGILFLLWFVGRAVAVWRKRSATSVDPHLMLQRAASLVVVLLLAHSFVDYPLRTTALSVLFAFASAVLLNPPKQLNPNNR